MNKKTFLVKEKKLKETGVLERKNDILIYIG